MAEQEAVNFKVVGSTPTGGAKIDHKYPLEPFCLI